MKRWVEISFNFYERFEVILRTPEKIYCYIRIKYHLKIMQVRFEQHDVSWGVISNDLLKSCLDVCSACQMLFKFDIQSHHFCSTNFPSSTILLVQVLTQIFPCEIRHLKIIIITFILDEWPWFSCDFYELGLGPLNEERMRSSHSTCYCFIFNHTGQDDSRHFLSVIIVRPISNARSFCAPRH